MTYRILKATRQDARKLRDIWWEGKDAIPLKTEATLEQQIGFWEEWTTYRHAWKLLGDGAIQALMLVHGDEIEYIVVRESYRGKRAATRLLSYAKRRVRRRGGRCLIAKTKGSNAPMRAALVRAGFVFKSSDADDWSHYEWNA